ncbi:MAG: hypothetical protein H6822_32475 [Planctomycetaceae bacterium]|nr:hypothetical protein [Planctomycetales bacterium]MCB9926902.1 hypothetical protein [Planctomycetaceae bacterium]
MPEPTIDDYRWLVSEYARPFLDEANSSATSYVALNKRLRRDLTSVRTHLVLEQVELRERARAKFSQPEHMFFTRKLLEQSTDEWIAGYKASRFPKGQPVADLCCGIGGDSLALAGRGPCVAIDRDSIATLLVEANCRALDASDLTCEVADVLSIVEGLSCSAWHIDPDRRVAKQRTSQAVYSEPSLDVIHRLYQEVNNGAIKLAPGAELNDDWIEEETVELEWIGSRRECRQQVVWLGGLARRVGQRTATIVHRQDESHSFTGDADREVDVAVPGRFIYAPASTLLAARLDAALAEQLQLRATSYGVCYYSADQYCDSPLFDVFKVDELMNLDVKKLRLLLRDRRVGMLEIKVRGVEIDPANLRKRLQLKGNMNASLLVFRNEGEVKVAVCHRYAPTQTQM